MTADTLAPHRVGPVPSRAVIGLALVVLCLACRPESLPIFDSSPWAEDPVVQRLIDQRLQRARSTNESEAWLQLAMAFEANDFLEQATTSYRHALVIAAERGGEARLHYHLGVTLSKNGDIAGAQQALSISASEDPTYAPTFWRLGEAELLLDRPPAARKNFRRALQIDPKFSPAIVGLSRLHLNAGEAEEAIALLDPVVRENPSATQATYLLGLAHRSAGNALEARRLTSRTSEPAENRLGSGGQRTLADPWQADVAQLRVDHRTVFEMAHRAMVSGDPESAIELLEDLRVHRPEDVTLGLNLATLLRGTGRQMDALDILRSLHRTQPRRVDVLTDLATSLLALGEREEALERARDALALAPGDDGLRQLFGTAGLLAEDPTP